MTRNHRTSTAWTFLEAALKAIRFHRARRGGGPATRLEASGGRVAYAVGPPRRRGASVMRTVRMPDGFATRVLDGDVLEGACRAASRGSRRSSTDERARTGQPLVVCLHGKYLDPFVPGDLE